jgi:hypothetical protein
LYFSKYSFGLTPEYFFNIIPASSNNNFPSSSGYSPSKTTFSIPELIIDLAQSEQGVIVTYNVEFSILIPLLAAKSIAFFSA